MEEYRKSQYPTILQAIHLIILYIFIQTIVDFPLAIIDYYKDTEYLYHPIKKILLGVGSTVFILYFGYRQTKNRILEVFPLKHFNPLVILPIVTFFIGAQQLLNYVNNWVAMVIPPPTWFWEMFNKIFENDFGFGGAFFKVVIIAPVVEELIFRGVIMHGLMRNYTKFTAIFFSGLLFALFHLNPWQFPATFVLGLLLGWIMIRSQNILFAIAGHAINNLLVLLSLTFNKEIETSFVSEFTVPQIVVISLVLVVISLAAIYFLTKTKRTLSQIDSTV